MKISTNTRSPLRAWRNARQSGTGGRTLSRSVLAAGLVVGATAVSLVASTPTVSAVDKIDCFGPDLVMTQRREVLRVDKDSRADTAAVPLIASSYKTDTTAPLVVPGVDYFNEVGVVDGGTRVIFTGKIDTTSTDRVGKPVLVDVDLVTGQQRIVQIPADAWTPRNDSVGVSGSYDPKTKLFYFGDYQNDGVQGGIGYIELAAYDPSKATAAITPKVLKVLAPAVNAPPPTEPQPDGPEAGLQGGNGDFTFDADGNLYLVNSRKTSFVLYRVAGPVTQYDTGEVVADTIDYGSTATGGEAEGDVINGIAFGSDGLLYTSGVDKLRIFDLNSETYKGAIPVTGTDLASCVDPSRISIYKDLPAGRVKPGDQFAIEVQGPPTNAFTFGYQAVTRGEETGLQKESEPATGFQEFVGPLIGSPGIKYTITEMASGTTNLDDYTTTWECINAAADDVLVANGTGTTGEFTLPAQAGGGSNVVCTFTNLPVKAATLTIQKDLPSGRFNVGDQFTLAADGAPSVTTTGSATGIQPQKAKVDRAMAGTEYKFSETAAGTTILDYYETTWECVDSDAASVVKGTGSSGAVTMPAGGKDVVCTFSNTPKPPDLQVQKDSNPVKGTELVAGQSVEYTLTFKNDGEVPAEVDYYDDLQLVLDDADVTVPPKLATGAGLSVSGIAVGQFSITGELAPKSTATVTYTATVLPDGERTDDLLVNYLLKRGDQKGECADTDPLCTKHPVIAPLLLIAKSADPVKGTELVAGQEVKYTLTFTNTGKAPAAIDFVDELSGVVDDADVIVDPAVATGEGVTVSGIADNKFTIKGELAGNTAATVTYTAKVKPDGQRGDNLLVNFLLKPGEVKTECKDTDNLCTKHPVNEPNLNVEKSSDPVSGTTLVAGDEVVYTLSFENTGKAPATVNYLDNLEDVLDDATVIVDPALATGEGLTVSGVTDGEFSITGQLAANSSATVTYTAKVKPDVERNNDLLVNYLLQPGGNKTVCEEGDKLCTKHPVVEPDPSVAKSSDPVKGTELVAGESVKYTLTFNNSGKAPAAFDYVDNLADVLDDATVTVQPALATGAGLTVSAISDGTFTIKGSVAAGTSATVTYTVKVKADADRGNDLLVNYLLEPGETKTECADTDPLCTKHPVVEPDLAILKTSEPVSGTTLLAGEEVVYTLTFTNSGKAPSKVDYVDKMGDVLDDATVTVAPALATGTGLTVSPIVLGDFRIEGELAAGATATVTATVKVKADGDRGNDLLANFLLKPGDTKTVCEDGDTDCTKHPVVEPALLIAKSSDPVKGTELKADQLVTYTLSFSNANGTAPSKVDYVDNLVDVLDDATVTVQPKLATGAGLTVSAIAAGKFTVTGQLAAGASATVTYTAKVNADGDRGNNLLVNYLLKPGEVKTVCLPTDTTCTNHPVPETPAISLVKVAASVQDVDGSGSNTVGDIVSYEFTVTNTGQNALSNIVLSDPKLSDQPLVCPKTTLAVGEQMKCSTVTYVILALDLGAGAVFNTATVSGVDPFGTKVTATDDAVVPVTATPTIAPPPPPDTTVPKPRPPKVGSSAAGPLAAMATFAVMAGSALILLSRVRRRQVA